ncbi:MFS transporter [Leucobacter sp. USHLN153]|uniref:MFS transporter n=1 Tax=Leucobacter sp. USHLN153 TaxID=3081268 RepID=UPI00301B6859
MQAGRGSTDGGEGAGAEDPRAARGSAAYRRALIALFCAGVATFAQMYSPQGLLPEIARSFGVDAGASSWAIGATTIGVAVGALLWARLSDRIGRVRAMRWATLAAALVGVVAPFAPGFAPMLALRAIEGFALAGIPALAVTLLAETVRPGALGGAVGSYIAGTTLGGLVGRLLAGAVEAEFGWRAGMLSVAVLAALAATAFIVLVPPVIRPAPAPPRVVAALFDAVRRPGVVVLVAHAFLTMGAFVAAFNALAFRLELPPYSLSLVQVSWLFLVYFAGTLASAVVWRFAARTSPTAVLLGSLAVVGGGLALTLSSSLIMIIAGLLLFTGGFFGAHTIASGLTGRRAAGTPGASQAPPLYNLGYYAGSSLLGWAGTAAFGVTGWSGTVTMVAVAMLLAAVLAWAYARAHGGVTRVDRRDAPNR